MGFSPLATAPMLAQPQPAAFASSPPAEPFSLTPSRDDTALYRDNRFGFSHLLPGRPVLIEAKADDPPADAAIQLQDAPITVRYRIEGPSFAASSAGELARGTAERNAQWRAQAVVNVDFANDSWLASWGAEAAAVAAYDVPAASGEALREDLFVLVRHGAVLLVTWTYPRAFIEDPAYATFASVAEATMIWDFARWEQRGHVWPDGAFLGPGLYGAAKAKYNELASQLGSASILPDERSQLLAILSGIVSAAGAPWVLLAPQMIEANKHAVLAGARNGRLRAFIDEAFRDVQTAHDLRGLAIFLGRALDLKRRA